MTPEEELEALEAEALGQVAGLAISALEEAVGAILTAYAGTVEALGEALTPAQAKALGAAVARAIRALPMPEMSEILETYRLRAEWLGIGQAARVIPPGSTRERALTAQPRKKRPPTKVDRRLKATLEEAATLAAQGIRTKTQAASVAGKVKAARNNLENTVTYAVNEGVSAGTAQVAQKLERRLLWYPERNACLHCLAMAGWAVEPGADFPALTFDPKGTSLPAVKWPPRHPRCRCRVKTYEGPAGAPPRDKSDVSAAAALAREARRSVVYQWTDYASVPASQAAAERLLTRGAGLPSTVEQRARRALRKGGVRRPG